MRRILGSPAFLLGPAIALAVASGCGAGEGSRCQINADCASGLFCSEDSTGNGICKATNAAGTTSADAAAKPDASLSTGPEVEPAIDATIEPMIDAESPIDVEPAVEVGPAADDGMTAEAGVGMLPDATASVDSDTTSPL